ncbi:MAG: adenosine deaminase [Clostridiales bacterium]|nr:adenosine deaminase [Clostridiales bacterium]
MKNGIDLHLHLDGSLSPAYVIRQAKKQGLELPSWDEKELAEYMRAPHDCRNLNEYLEKFDLPCSILQTEDALTDAVADLCQRLKGEGLSYAEIRFAPQLHLQKGLSQDQVTAAAIRGLRCDETFEAKLILCCMRMAGNEKENLQTIRTAAKYLGEGVAAADLAGAEALFPTSSFKEIFEEAVKEGIPFTIHAGEAAGPESIWAALEMGAKRIGHGIRCLEDEKLVVYLREHQIPLEVCPTSNFQTRAVAGHYPLKEMVERGLAVTLNTDNLTVSDTTLEKEFRIAEEVLGLTKKQLETVRENAVKARFKSNAKKR